MRLATSRQTIAPGVSATGRLVERYEYEAYGKRSVYSHGTLHSDIDEDSDVDSADNDILAGVFGNVIAAHRADLSGDGEIDGIDLAILADDTGDRLPAHDPLVLHPRDISARLNVYGTALPSGLCPIGHQGLYHDEELGNDAIANRARYRKGERFLQRDPLGYLDGMNGYAGYHVMRGGVDPLGLDNTAANDKKMIDLWQKWQNWQGDIKVAKAGGAYDIVIKEAGPVGQKAWDRLYGAPYSHGAREAIFYDAFNSSIRQSWKVSKNILALHPAFAPLKGGGLVINAVSIGINSTSRDGAIAKALADEAVSKLEAMGTSELKDVLNDLGADSLGDVSMMLYEILKQDLPELQSQSLRYHKPNRKGWVQEALENPTKNRKCLDTWKDIVLTWKEQDGMYLRVTGEIWDEKNKCCLPYTLILEGDPPKLTLNHSDHNGAQAP